MNSFYSSSFHGLGRSLSKNGVCLLILYSTSVLASPAATAPDSDSQGRHENLQSVQRQKRQGQGQGQVDIPASPTLKERQEGLERWKSDPSVSNATRAKRQYMTISEEDDFDSRVDKNCYECECDKKDNGNGYIVCYTSPFCRPCRPNVSCGYNCDCVARNGECMFTCGYPEDAC